MSHHCIRLLALAALAVAACADRPLDLPLMTPHDFASALPLDMADTSGGPRDLAQADLASRDLAVQRDMAMTVLHDMTMVRDMTSAPDLSPSACVGVVVTTLTGNGTFGWIDGSGGANGTTALGGPDGLALAGDGTLYVSDFDTNRIRKIAPDGSSSTLTGNGTAGFVDGSGGANGTTELNGPSQLTLDGNGNLYVSDYYNSRIRKIAPDGSTTTLSGNGQRGFFDGSGGANGTSKFDHPYGIAFDGKSDTIYVGDYGGWRIRKVAADGSTTTLAGNGRSGFFDGSGGANGTTQFVGPATVALAAQGAIVVGDYLGNRVRKVASDGSTTTLTGNGNAGWADGTGGASGSTILHRPCGVSADAEGNVYVADQLNHRIRKIAPDGTTTTLAGDGTLGFADGNGCTARFGNPTGILVSGKRLYVADHGNERIRVIQLP